MTIARRPIVPVLVAAMLVVLLPSTAWAASPIAGDDPAPGCSEPSWFDGSFPIPEDWGQLVFPADPRHPCWIGYNDSDPDGDPLTWSLVTPPQHGDLILGSDGRTAYTADPDYSTRMGIEPGGSWLSDSYVYQVSDGTTSDTATVRYWIAPINDPPTFTPGPRSIHVDEDTPYSDAWATDVSPGPGASESLQTITFSVTDGPDHSLFAVGPAVDADGTLTFTPAPNRHGTSTFVITARDDGGLEDYGVANTIPPDDTSDPVTVYVTIHSVVDDPIAVDDAVSIAEDTLDPVEIRVLANDIDVDGIGRRVMGATQGGKGTVALISNISVTYKPQANANGADSFEYMIDDGHGGTVSATVAVTIIPVNDAPIAIDDVATVERGTATPLDVLANDLDVDGDVVHIVSAAGATKGTLAIVGGGSGLTYEPDPEASGTDTFDYVIDDGHGETDSATVTVSLATDTAPPAITGLSESLPGQTVGTSTVRARITWAGSDPGSGIANYHVQVSVNGGAYGTIALPSPTATWVDHSLTTGSTYQFRVRAKDRQGNVSAFTAWPPMTPTRIQDGSTLASYTGPWSTAIHPSASNGRSRYASSASRKVVVRFIGRDVGWVATRTTSSGRADVRIDGVLVGTIQLDRSATAFRQLVLGYHLSTTGWHTIDIRPRGDGRVDLDALVVLR